MSIPNNVDVKAWIDSRPITGYQWLVVAAVLLIIMFDGYDTAIMGFIVPELLAKWGLSRAEIGLVLGCAMFGVVLGALITGPLADRYGRKRLLLLSVAVFALFSLLSAFSSSPEELALMRFITGLGLGAAMPNCVTLIAEYIPVRRQGIMITLMYSGFSIGSGIAGFIAAWMIPAWGWESVLIFGGVVPLVLLPLLLWFLPESPMFMVARHFPSEKIAATLQRMGGAFTAETQFALVNPVAEKSSRVKQLFTPGYAWGTVVLWLTYFMGLFVIYMLNGWLPTVLRDGGINLQHAAIITGVFQLGGIGGGIIVGSLMDRMSRKKVIGAFYLLGSLSLLTLGMFNFSPLMLGLFVFISGVCINGAQTGMQAFAPAFYPTGIRATGVSWMHGIGRTGAILSTTTGGLLIGLFAGPGAIFYILALPTLFAMLVVINHRDGRGQTVSGNDFVAAAREMK